MSFSIKRGGFRFGSGTTFAAFHIAGINPSRNELLNIAVIGAARMLALSLKMHAGILSGPIALFILTRYKTYRIQLMSSVAMPCDFKLESSSLAKPYASAMLEDTIKFSDQSNV